MDSKPQLAVTAPTQRRLFPAAETALSASLCLLVAVLVLLPVLAVALGAMQDAGGISVRWLTSVLSSTRIIGNTLVVGVGTTALAVIVGGTLARLVRIGTGRGVPTLVILPPRHAALTAIAWSWLGSPRDAASHQLVRPRSARVSLVG